MAATSITQRHTIGVLTGWQVYERAILRNYLGPLLRGVRAAAREAGCNLLLACGVGPAIVLDELSARPTQIVPAWPEPAPDTRFVPVGPQNTDGLIVVNPLMTSERGAYIDSLREQGHPLVFVGTAYGGPAVGLDNHGGVRQALTHLVEHGHRRIAFIGGIPGDERGDSGERLRAYRQIVAEQELARDPALIAYGFHSEEGGAHAMRQLLATESHFTALLASSDESAIGALHVLRSRGIRVPEDVALIGFDDQPEAALQSPPLTTVHSPTFERGRQALSLVVRCIAGLDVTEEIVTVSTHLAVRCSCGCSPERAATVPALSVDSEDARANQSRTLSDAVMAGVRFLDQDEVMRYCRHLVDAFCQSLRELHPGSFGDAVASLVAHLERSGEDVRPWLQAVVLLRQQTDSLLEAMRADAEEWGDPIARRSLAETVLFDAVVALTKSVERRHQGYVFQQRRAADRVAQLTARLLTALEEPQIFEILGTWLPKLGIPRAGVAFFEPTGDDPVAWSLLHAVNTGKSKPLCFRSRHFPPPGLYPSEEPLSLALLPLEIQSDEHGFVVFDATNLELCGLLVYQLSAALKITRLYQEATRGRRLAEEANRLKSQFLSTVSHELRTPLNLIVGLSELLLDGGADPVSFRGAYREDLERIYANAQHLDGLIGDVLDLARSQTGQLRLAREPVELADVLDIVATVGEQLAHDKGLAWRAVFPAQLPRVWGDATRLRQVLLNLIGNAVKFTQRGEIRLEVEAGEDDVIIRVADTGVGIPSEEQQLIFDEFRQSKRTVNRGYGGLGLGLAICKQLVEVQGGQIGVSSSGEEGAGSIFYVKLPRFKPPVDIESAAELALSPDRCVLLLVSDYQEERRLYDHLLQEGFDVDMLLAEEIERWTSRLVLNPPAAVLLGQTVAADQGWAVLKNLRTYEVTRDVPVLFYALTHDEKHGSLLELNYLTKPMGSTTLIRALEHQITQATAKAPVILLVDDEPGILEMHARIIRSWREDASVLTAENGREALTLLRRERPDLLLLDLVMPEVDGFEVLEAMRASPGLLDVPVLVLTGQTLAEEEMERLNHGVTKVLNKGIFTVEETLAHITSALSRECALGQETRWLVRRVVAYLQAHYAEDVHREEVAEHVGVSVDHLSRCFGEEMGISFVTYLNRYRIHKSKDLLVNSSLSVTDIALDVGFSSASYFCRIFKRETEMSPGTYRKAMG